ncbi:DUF6268 family outer membrane beta-barrel protein [Aquimarina brevivitae]|uniref:Outer membrane protein with beta-barrel domain n=1 Tax=Aquimarina brevivitae TaxID=323412 RepID=A0A4Q7PM17_9FLAO|nr:DUF6268 family outer membrane beta-barrel protein [Aquimarina brevivitae]RZT00033.1 hypothetical protein EV197_1263 [Aquimarina brevivitae]
MRNRNIVFLISFILSSFCTYSQVADLARVEYTFFPQRRSDNSFKRFRALLNFPIKLNDKGAYFVTGLEYRSVQFDYEDFTDFDSSNLDQFKSFEVSAGYTFKINNDWRYAMKAGLLAASDFSSGGLNDDDLLVSASVFFIKDKKNEVMIKPWRLILGLQYSTTAGRPFPLPIINYWKRLNASWSYTLGVPKSNLKYYFSDKDIVQAFATLDGFYANLQDNLVIGNNGDTNRVADSISMTIALGGFGYEHYFTDHLLLYFYSGFTLINDIRLRNNNNEDVLTINDENTLYLRAGLKFKI